MPAAGPTATEHRIESLECLRGLAALSVVAWHLLLAFAPRHSGQFADAVADPFIGRLWFAPFNGAAAVTFFFVLSGFVLPWSYFGSRDPRTTARALVKRWPRLAGACCLSVLASWLLFRLGAYRYAEAAAITGSPWLADFGYAGLPPGFAPRFGEALLNGAFGVFVGGGATFNAALWTMHPEVVGGFVSIALAPALAAIRGPAVLVSLVMVLAIFLGAVEEHIPQFLAGTLLARLLHGRSFSIPPLAAGAMLLAAFLLFSFNGPSGAFAWLRRLIPSGYGSWRYYPVAWVPASVLLMLAALGSRHVARCLAGSWARMLGRLSFPIYLVHLPVIFSLGCWSYLRLVAALPPLPAIAATVLISLSGIVAVAMPLGGFDRWWVGAINRAVLRLR
jgi:peptidoglycan/LPS O-acetylase OafA/YrhL